MGNTAYARRMIPLANCGNERNLINWQTKAWKSYQSKTKMNWEYIKEQHWAWYSRTVGYSLIQRRKIPKLSKKFTVIPLNKIQNAPWYWQTTGIRSPWYKEGRRTLEITKCYVLHPKHGKFSAWQISRKIPGWKIWRVTQNNEECCINIRCYINISRMPHKH